jgi:uncharacterized membrane protein HdeD (DUF308 family)
MAAPPVVEDGTLPWWVVLCEGIAAIVVGVLLLAAPDATLELVIQVFGLFWLVGGILRVVSAFTDPVDRAVKLEAGVVGILGGIAVMLRPLWLANLLTWTLVVVLGSVGLIIGAISLYHAFHGGGWGAGAVGVISLLFGVALLLNPLINEVAWVSFYGWIALICGIVAVVISFAMRRDSLPGRSARSSVPVAGTESHGSTV